MARQILVEERRGKRSPFWLDADSGRLSPAAAIPAGASKGNTSVIEGSTFALYADGGVLWFQWNDRRWPLAAPDLELTYAHDLARRVTTFTANGQSIDYPAWWRDDPQFDPLVPEQDAQEDYLAYVIAIQEDADLQASVLARWGRAP